MALDEKFNFGNEAPEGLVKRLDNMYDNLSSEVNVKAGVLELFEAPDEDTAGELGQIVVESSVKQAYILVDIEENSFIWKQIT